MSQRPVYLDHHATTPMDARVLDAMMPYLKGEHGNPSSKTHVYGWTAEAAVDLGREELAGAVGAMSSEIVFTSGATEANNLAMQGAIRAAKGNHVVISAVEHPAVRRCAEAMRDEGYELSVLPVGTDGILNPDAVVRAIKPETALVSVIMVQSEIGVIQPISAIVDAVKSVDPRILVHSDCAQALGRVAVDAQAIGLDMMSFSAHKAYGPKGIGALWVRKKPRVHLQPMLFGGGQEGGLRPGTLSPALCMGMGRAARLACEELESDAARLRKLSERLFTGLQSRASEDIQLHGSRERRVAGNLSLSVPGVSADALILQARDVAFSAGSACSSGSGKASPVLTALGLDSERAAEVFRLGLGRTTSAEDVTRAIDSISAAISNLRKSASGATA